MKTLLLLTILFGAQAFAAKKITHSKDGVYQICQTDLKIKEAVTIPPISEIDMLCQSSNEVLHSLDIRDRLRNQIFSNASIEPSISGVKLWKQVEDFGVHVKPTKNKCVSIEVGTEEKPKILFMSVKERSHARRMLSQVHISKIKHNPKSKKSRLELATRIEQGLKESLNCNKGKSKSSLQKLKADVTITGYPKKDQLKFNIVLSSPDEPLSPVKLKNCRARIGKSSLEIHLKECLGKNPVALQEK